MTTIEMGWLAMFMISPTAWLIDVKILFRKKNLVLLIIPFYISFSLPVVDQLCWNKRLIVSLIVIVILETTVKSNWTFYVGLSEEMKHKLLLWSKFCKNNNIRHSLKLKPFKCLFTFGVNSRSIIKNFQTEFVLWYCIFNLKRYNQ